MCFSCVGLWQCVFLGESCGSRRPSGASRGAGHSALAGSRSSDAAAFWGSGLLSVSRKLRKQHVPGHKPVQRSLHFLNILPTKRRADSAEVSDSFQHRYSCVQIYRDAVLLKAPQSPSGERLREGSWAGRHSISRTGAEILSGALRCSGSSTLCGSHLMSRWLITKIKYVSRAVRPGHVVRGCDPGLPALLLLLETDSHSCPACVAVRQRGR